MKRSRLLLITLLFAGTVSCDISILQDALDDFVPVIALEPITTTGVIQLIDAATGELVTAQTTVSFTQPNGGQVIDMYSDPMSSVTSSNGFVNFGISNNLVPSATNGVSVLMTFSAAGYQTKTQEIKINSTGSNAFVVVLIQQNNPPRGIVFQTEGKGAISATSGTPGTVVLQPSGTPGTSTTEFTIGTDLIISSGIILKDANGTPLSGQLTAKTEYYDTSVPMVFEGLPNAVTDLAEKEDLLILGVATMSITDASGRRAVSFEQAASSKHKTGSNTQFENPITSLIWFTLPQNNPYTQILPLTFLQTWDPSWMNPITYTSWWTPESVTWMPGYGYVELPLTGDYIPYSWALYSQVETVDGTLQVVRNGNTGPINYEIFALGSRFSGVIPSDKSSVDLSGLKTVDYQVTVDNSISEFVIEKHNFGTSRTATITMTTPPPTVINVDLNVQLRCTDPSTYLRVTNIPGASVQYRKVGAPSGTLWRQGQNLSFNYDAATQILAGGRVTLNQVELNERYDIKIIYDDEEASSAVTMTGTTVSHTETLDSDICR
jgi:hypothetical protein